MATCKVPTYHRVDPTEWLTAVPVRERERERERENSIKVRPALLHRAMIGYMSGYPTNSNLKQNYTKGCKVCLCCAGQGNMFGK